MGLLDLSTSAASQKHVDLNDARYQLVDKLKNTDKKNIRPTFTLYDNKEIGHVTTKEISTAYALSDKKLPMGELLNKMADIIIDLEDGVLDNEKDAIYVWKYSMTILAMYEDKINNKRYSSLDSFDNGLKNLILISKEFANKFPGKYTSRTNFFDSKIKDQLILDVITIFRDVTVPKLHDLAIKQSQAIAEKHDNPTLNKIVKWAIDNYKCTVDSYYDVKMDKGSGLYYSLNTIVLHMKNGYDMSIVGFVGTDHDDKFAISTFNTNNAVIKDCEDKQDRDAVQSALDKVSELDAVNPVNKILNVERRRRDELKAQLNYLQSIRPMVKKDLLDLKVARDVVGDDYIWGCEHIRKTYGELPEGFKFEDLKLPKLTSSENADFEKQFVSGISNINDANDEPKKEEKYQDIFSDSNKEAIDDTTVSELDEKSVLQDTSETETQQVISETPSVSDEPEKNIIEDNVSKNVDAAVPSEEAVEDMFANSEQSVEEPIQEEPLFVEEAPQPEEHKKEFGEKKEAEAPILVKEQYQSASPTIEDKPKKKEAFDSSSILLPGIILSDEDDEPDAPNYTGEAVKAEETTEPAISWAEPTSDADTELPHDEELIQEVKKVDEKPAAEIEAVTSDKKDETKKELDDSDEIKTPDLMFDDIESLFQ